MKRTLKVFLGLLLVLVALGALGFGWAKASNARKLSRQIETHGVDFPVPFPLDEAEAEALMASAGEEPLDLDQVALQRAIDRGRHLLEARYACAECHGADFGGGVMVDDPMFGRILGPNVTAGRGGVTSDYSPADWDRIVRHGVKADGTPGAMPSEDFQLMSDQELSDVVAYIRSRPTVDAEVPPVSLGPLGTMLMALGALPVSADLIEDHLATHPRLPPESDVSVEFGRHLAGVCTGCHGLDLAGGAISAGDPSWPPASNLTPHPDGLADWTYEQFEALLRTGVRPDGTEARMPMTLVIPYTGNMTDVEVEALWVYLRSVPALPTGD